MLTLHIPEQELYSEETATFIDIPGQKLVLEHSLVSLSKWEAKWHKPFLSKTDKTAEEVLDYVKCMTITQNVNPVVYHGLNHLHMQIITDYINDPMSATTFRDMNNKPSREIITAEIIYYWMISFNIPIECQKWHLNRLLSLIKVCTIKANSKSGKRKLTKSDILARNRLNEERRRAMNSSG